MECNVHAHAIFDASLLRYGTVNSARLDADSVTMMGPNPFVTINSSADILNLTLSTRTQVWYNEGTALSGGHVTSVDCAGANINCTQSGSSITVTITGGAGGEVFGYVSTRNISMDNFALVGASITETGRIIGQGSATIRGIIISSAGALMGGTTIQGVFLLEGGTFQFRNGTNEFSMTFATRPSAGQHLMVTDVTGDRVLITGGGDSAGGGGVGDGNLILSVGTGSAQAFNWVSSPTVNINFSSGTHIVQLRGGATAYISLDFSSITAKGDTLLPKADFTQHTTTAGSLTANLLTWTSTATVRIDELQADLSTHSVRVDELQADLSTHSVRIDELQADLSTHTADIDDLWTGAASTWSVLSTTGVSLSRLWTVTKSTWDAFTNFTSTTQVAIDSKIPNTDDVLRSTHIAPHLVLEGGLSVASMSATGEFDMGANSIVSVSSITVSSVVFNTPDFGSGGPRVQHNIPWMEHYVTSCPNAAISTITVSFSTAPTLYITFFGTPNASPNGGDIFVTFNNQALGSSNRSPVYTVNRSTATFARSSFSVSTTTALGIPIFGAESSFSTNTYRTMELKVIGNQLNVVKTIMGHAVIATSTRTGIIATSHIGSSYIDHATWHVDNQITSVSVSLIRQGRAYAEGSKWAAGSCLCVGGRREFEIGR